MAASKGTRSLQIRSNKAEQVATDSFFLGISLVSKNPRHNHRYHLHKSCDLTNHQSPLFVVVRFIDTHVFLYIMIKFLEGKTIILIFSGFTISTCVQEHSDNLARLPLNKTLEHVLNT